MCSIKYIKVRYSLILPLALVLIGCESKNLTLENNCDQALKYHSKEIFLQRVHDARYRLRHPASTLEDIKLYNQILFSVFISDLELFREIHPSLPLFREEQKEMLLSLLPNNDPMDFERFGNLTIKSDAKHIAILSDIKESNKLRLLLLENFNDSQRVFSSYKNEAKLFAEEVRKTIKVQ